MLSTAIEFYLPVTIVIIPDMLVTNLITKLYQSCLDAMASQTMLAGMKFFINGTQNSHGMDTTELPLFKKHFLKVCKSWHFGHF